MTLELCLTVLGSSLLGSLHCALMCGGLVSALGVFDGDAKSNRWAELAFHGGRLVVYLTLGVLAGALGGVVDLAGVQVGVVRVAAVLAGSLLLASGLWGFMKALGFKKIPRFTGSAGSVWAGSGWLNRRFGGRRFGPGRRAFVLGLSSGLLPCGWLYAFVISAAGTGSIWLGALVLFAFWFGTVPALAGTRLVLTHLSFALKKHVPLLGSALLLLVGLSAILLRVNIPAHALSGVKGALSDRAGAEVHAPACH